MTTIAQQLQAEAKNTALKKELFATCAGSLFDHIVDSIRKNKCQWYPDFNTVEVQCDRLLDDQLLQYCEFYYTLDSQFETQLRTVLTKNGFDMYAYKLKTTRLETIGLSILGNTEAVKC